MDQLTKTFNWTIFKQKDEGKKKNGEDNLVITRHGRKTKTKTKTKEKGR